MTFDFIQPSSALPNNAPMPAFGPAAIVGECFAKIADQLSLASSLDMPQVKGPSFGSLDPFLSPDNCAVAPAVDVAEGVALHPPSTQHIPDTPTEPRGDSNDGFDDQLAANSNQPNHWNTQQFAIIISPPTPDNIPAVQLVPSQVASDGMAMSLPIAATAHPFSDVQSNPMLPDVFNTDFVAVADAAPKTLQTATIALLPADEKPNIFTPSLAARFWHQPAALPKPGAENALTPTSLQLLTDLPAEAPPKSIASDAIQSAYVDAPQPGPQLVDQQTSLLVTRPAINIDPLSDRQLDFALSDQWLADLANDIAALQKEEGKLAFRLRPEQLGTMDVEVSRKEQRLVVEISAKNGGAENIISSALPRLEQELRSRGFAHVEAQLSGGGSQTPQRETHSQHRPPNLQIETERFAARKADRQNHNPSPAGLFA